MKCPFRKITTTTTEYHYYDRRIEKTTAKAIEAFAECSKRECPSYVLTDKQKEFCKLCEGGV